MPTTHTVLQGECVSSLAYKYRLTVDAIYEDPNNADLKSKRPNPNVFLPGDQLYIPDPKQREDDEPTDRRHIFVVNYLPTYINIRLQNVAQEPIANARYQLKLDAVTLSGTTDDDGWIRGQIPACAELGTLKVWASYPDGNDTVIEMDVKLGWLDPLDTVLGIKGRLNNLGYDCGEVSDVEDDLYRYTVSQFQQDNGLEVSGLVDDPTRAALEKAHRV
jgi:N-acetylmuramoyl-L-alanine amidase